MSFRTLSKVFAVAFLSLCSAVAAGQSMYSTMYATVEGHQYDSIDLATLNVSVVAPILYRGGPVPESMFYGWTYHMSTNGPGGNGEWWPIGSDNDVGSTMMIHGISTTGMGFLKWATSTQVDCGPPYHIQITKVSAPYFLDSLGISHTLPTLWYWYFQTNQGPYCVNPTSQAGYTSDGLFYIDTVSGLIADRSGNTYAVGKTDPNGNVATPTTTSLGQPFLTALSNGGFQYTDASGNPRQVVPNWTTAALVTNFGCANPLELNHPNTSFLASISYPDGTSLGVTYEQTAGYSSGNYTGRIQSLVLPTGGTITYGYSGGNAPGPGMGIYCYTIGGPPEGATPTLTRTTAEGAWTYIATYYPASGYNYSATTITDPSGNNSVYTFLDTPTAPGSFGNSEPRLVRKQSYQGSVSPGNLLATQTYCYNNLTTFANCANATANPRNWAFTVTEEDVYTTLQGVTGSSEVATSYDSDHNVTSVKKYNFGASAPTTITTTTYGSWNGSACVAIGNYVVDHPCEVTVSDGTHISSDTRFAYDAKGNLLTRTSLVSGIPSAGTWLSSSTTHNSNGTTNTVTDAAGMVTTFGYNGAGGCNSLLPTSTAIGTPTTTYFTTYATYDCLGDKLLTTTDANSNVTSSSYTAHGADPFYAAKSLTGALGEVVSIDYTPMSTSSTLAFGSVTETSISYVDSLGRLSERQTLDGSQYDSVMQTYGWGTASNGAPAPFGAFGTATSVPCRVPIGAPCSGSPVTTTYLDGLGRTSSVVDAAGGTISYTYTGQDVLAQVSPAPAGESVKKIQTEYDGLGRVKSVCQILNSGGSSCGQAAGGNGYATTYSYSLLSGGTQVVNTKGAQSHTSSFDGLGRLILSVTPEKGTIQYVYDAPTSSCSTLTGQISSAGDLVEVIDNSLVHTCYKYDPLHRVTDVYTNGPSTYCRRFRYDNTNGVLGSLPAGISLTNALGRVAEAETDTCASPITVSSIITDEWLGYDREGRVTDLWELTPHSGGVYYHTTAGYLANGIVSSLSGIPGYTAMTYGVDANGRPITAAEGSTNVVSGVTRNSAGQPVTISVGNSGGDTSNYGWDPNTGRMANWTFTVGSTPLSQTGTLTWNQNGTLRQLIISDGFNAGGSQTCKFGTSSAAGYDELGRLVSDDCGSAWSQTFSYDLYNNLTKTGSLSWACAACYNSANNQYNSVLSPSITYDANGRLTNDTFQKYNWNSYGELSGTIAATSGNITCGSSGFCYTYDAFGRMVESSQGSAYREILYSPLGKTATMSAQVTSSSYLPLPGGGTLYSTGVNGTNRFYQHKDWLGSARIESKIGARTVTYDRAFAPYGEMYDNFGVTTQLNFTGDTQDFDSISSSSLFDTPNRELHTAQGRWISPDPAGLAEVDFANPQNWNRYAYVTNNPLNAVDPLGLGTGCDDPHGPKHGGCNAHRPGGIASWLAERQGGCWLDGAATACHFLGGMSDSLAIKVGGIQIPIDRSALFPTVSFSFFTFDHPCPNGDCVISPKLVERTLIIPVAGFAFPPGMNGAAQAMRDMAKNFMKSTKPDPPLRGVPGKTPDATELSPLRQLLKDALDETGAALGGAASGASEIFILAPIPSILLHPNERPGDPDDCHCT